MLATVSHRAPPPPCLSTSAQHEARSASGISVRELRHEEVELLAFVSRRASLACQPQLRTKHVGFCILVCELWRKEVVTPATVSRRASSCVILRQRGLRGRRRSALTVAAWGFMPGSSFGTRSSALRSLTQPGRGPDGLALSPPGPRPAPVGDVIATPDGRRRGTCKLRKHPTC